MKPSPRLFIVEDTLIAAYTRLEAENKYRITEFTFRHLDVRQIKDQLDQRIEHEEVRSR